MKMTKILYSIFTVFLLANTQMLGQEMSEKTKPSLPDFDTLWDYSDPTGTRAKFEEIRAEAEQSKDQSYYLQLLTQIGRTYGLESKFDEAHAILDTVENQIDDNLKLVKVRYLLERGRTFRSSGEVPKSISLFNESFELAKAINSDAFAIDAAHMVAIAVESKDERLKWNLECIKIAEASDEPRAKKWLGSIYNNIGWDYHDAKDYEKALDMFEKALAYRIAQNKEPELGIAKWCVARCFRSLNRVDEALEIQKSLHERNKELGKPDGYVSEELGELYLVKGDSATAKTHFANAYNVLSKDDWFSKNEAKRLDRIKTLGGVE